MNKVIICKTIFLKVFVMSCLLLSVFANASDEDDQDVWTATIDEVQLTKNHIIIGDLSINLSVGFSVENTQGQSLSRSVLEPGLLVSTTPRYRNNQAYTNKIIVIE